MFLVKIVKNRTIERQHEGAPTRALLRHNCVPGQINLVDYLNGAKGRQV